MHRGHATVTFSEVREIVVIDWEEEDRKVSNDLVGEFCLPTSTHSLATKS
jgi:hypothetical protein